MDMENCHSDMKKKAAAEALQKLIQEMMGLEGKKTSPNASEHEGLGEKLASEGMPSPKDMHPEPPMDEQDQEKLDFMTMKKKPSTSKSMTVVMASASPKMKKKMKGM